MLQQQPHMRLGIADLVAHPWLLGGGTATEDEIREEFARRQQINKQKANEEEDRKNAQRQAMGGNAARRDFVMNGKRYIDVGEEFDERSAAADV